MWSSQVFSEPLPCSTSDVNGHSFSIWQQLVVQGDSSMTLAAFLKRVKVHCSAATPLQPLTSTLQADYGLEVESVVKVDGTMIYAPFIIPSHAKRLKKRQVLLEDLPGLILVMCT